jgi:hypothetical protein
MSKSVGTTAQTNKSGIHHFIVEELRKKVRNSKDMASEIADLLHLSRSAVYRKLSGEVPFTLLETEFLVKQFHISLDNYIFGGSSATGFRFKGDPKPEETVNSYYSKILGILQFFVQDNNNPELHMTTQEIVPFHYMNFPELTAFQILIWSRVTMRFPDIEDEGFRVEEKAKDPELLQLSKQVIQIYDNLPSMEYISSNILDKNLAALQHFSKHTVFLDPTTPLLICDQLELMVKHLFKMAKQGQKISYSLDKNTGSDIPYTLFHDILPNYDTNLLFKSSYKSFIYCSFDYPNFMSSAAPKMIDYVDKWMINCRSHSYRISGESEIYRTQLLQSFLGKIAHVKMILLQELAKK